MATESEASQAAGNSTGVLVALGLAMFVYVIDTTIMGVSISDLVVDLNTEVSLVQMAITVYTLTMAAFTVTGGKLGDIWGARKAFQVGLLIYLVGTITTAAAPNIAVLLIGWSVLEGLGSALMVPAINTLVRSNFPVSRRAAAYGTLGGVAAAGAAFGPIIGGWITTNYTWRIAFIVEAIIVVAVLVASRKIKDSARHSEREVKLDVLGVVLSVAGLGLLVFGILQTSTLGIGSPVVWIMIVVGLIVLGVFSVRALKMEERGEDALVRLSIMKHRVMSAGIPVTVAQTFAQNGVLFLVPLYAQMVLGLNALDTGITILPLSISVMLFSVGTANLGHKIAPRSLVQMGLVALFIGGILFAIAIPDSEAGTDFAISMFVIGAGVGLVAAQLPNMMLGGVRPDETSEASGLMGTAQNLGMSLGTAIAGTVVILTLSPAFVSQVEDSEVLAAADQDAIVEILEQNAETVGTEFETLLADEPQEVVDEVLRVAKDAGDDAFRLSALVLGLISLIGFVWAFRLPGDKLKGKTVDEAVRATSTIPKVQLEPTAGAAD